MLNLAPHYVKSLLLKGTVLHNLVMPLRQENNITVMSYKISMPSLAYIG